MTFQRRNYVSSRFQCPGIENIFFYYLFVQIQKYVDGIPVDLATSSHTAQRSFQWSCYANFVHRFIRFSWEKFCLTQQSTIYACRCDIVRKIYGEYTGTVPFSIDLAVCNMASFFVHNEIMAGRVTDSEYEYSVPGYQ